MLFYLVVFLITQSLLSTQCSEVPRTGNSHCGNLPVSAVHVFTPGSIGCPGGWQHLQRSLNAAADLLHLPDNKTFPKSLHTVHAFPR